MEPLQRFVRGLLAVFLTLLPPALHATTQIHISPTGNDANAGTAALPVRTPQGAQVRVRSLIQSGLMDSVEVIFAAGTYVMDAPLELRPQDSGTAAFPITWKASEAVILDGGKQITSAWTNAGGGIWHADLTGIGLGVGQWNFRELYVNGSRATRARFPNKSAANPYLYATGGSTTHAIIAPALVKAAWGTAADAQINIVPQSRFFNQWNTVSAVNTVTGRIDIADSERHRTIDAGSWFWIEGVEAELDDAGEWFLNPTTGRLYYMPTAGVDPNTLNIVAPFLNRIVNAKGDVDANTHVKSVHFDGLQFRHTSFTLGHIEARVHTDTAVMFENTLDCSVRNCAFENIGGYALWLHLDSQRNIFDNNNVQNSGGGGVLMTGARLAYMDDTKIYTPGVAASKVAPILNEVTRNTVEHCGKVRYYGGGVHMDSRPFSMTMSPGNLIARNHFNDLSRNGVFAFRNQGGNVVEYNRIHNAMQTTIDGGCIHFATMNHLNAPNFILNNWLYDIWGYEQKPDGIVVRRLANGIFLDWDTSNTTVQDNWIYNSVGGSVKTIWDNWNLVVSGNQSSATPITPPLSADVGPASTLTHGINLATNKLTGSVIHYTQTANFSTTGTWTQETAVGIVGLFEFNFLAGTAAVSSQAVYTLPITESGKYQISLLYKPGTDRASNVPISIAHAGGTANVTWNMQQGSTHGFAVEVGEWRFAPGGTNTVTLSTTGTNGKVIADGVAFVKIEDSAPAKFVRNLANGTAQRIVLYGTSLTAGGAWVSQFQSAVENAYPGLATWINSGGSGQSSSWGVTNLQTKVINENPDTVFIEFSMNDAAETLNVSRAQAIANLTTMVNGILAAHPTCEIILQIMNPADWQPGDTFNVRANLAAYQQDYRDFAAANGLRCVDHAPAFAALYEKGTTAYRVYVPDGIHPSAMGWASFMTPSLIQAVGLPTTTSVIPTTIIDNTDTGGFVLTGTWFASSASPGFQGTNYLHDGHVDKGIKTAVYTPNFLQAGTYPVFLRWAADNNRATNVPVTVNHSGGASAFTVNQRNASGWYKLGDFAFAAGTTGNVEIGTTGTNGYVVADAAGFGATAVGQPEVRLRMDNARAAEPLAAGGAARTSTIIAWIAEPAATNITVSLTYPTATAIAGLDYASLPSSITIPAGETSAILDFTPLADNLGEGDEPFRIKAATGSGYILSSPIEATILIENTTTSLIAEAFSGAAVALNGKTADAFSSAITSASGSSAWVAASTFLQNGAASGGNASAYLNLGTFINSARGTANGKFQLTATLAPGTGSWLSLGFATQNAPSTARNFTNAGSGVTTTGVATIIYRGQNSGIVPGELDMFGGTSNTNAVDGPDGLTGTRTITTTLDLTPSGGYNGTTNFGAITWTDSVLGTLGTFTHTTVRDFGSIFISGANTFTGGISNLTFNQILPPPPTFETWIAAYSLAPADQTFTSDPDRDGITNGLEQLFATNPTTFTPGPIALTASANTLTFQHPLNATAAAAVTHTYEWSTDLVEWRTSNQLNATGTRATITPSAPDINGNVTVTITITQGPNVKLFGRVTVVKVQ